MTDGDEEPALVASRCGAMLRGGVAPRRVLALLAEEFPSNACVTRAADLVAEGAEVPDALASCGGEAWRVLAVAWHIGGLSGAPLAAALDRIAGSLRAVQQLGERRSVLLAGPRATVRLVSALPPLALLLGGVLGFDPLSVLMSGVGVLLLGCGALLMWAGIAWARSMTRRAERRDRPAGLELELFWIALGGGAPPDIALVRLADSIDRFGAAWVTFDSLRRTGSIARIKQSAGAVGVPLRPLLLQEAETDRRQALADLEREAERLGITVLIPLAACVLPSFILIGVLPVILAMLGGAGL